MTTTTSSSSSYKAQAGPRFPIFGVPKTKTTFGKTTIGCSLTLSSTHQPSRLIPFSFGLKALKDFDCCYLLYDAIQSGLSATTGKQEDEATQKTREKKKKKKKKKMMMMMKEKKKKKKLLVKAFMSIN